LIFRNVFQNNRAKKRAKHLGSFLFSGKFYRRGNTPKFPDSTTSNTANVFKIAADLFA